MTDAIPAFTPVNLLTGSLGSGKTTLLRRLLADPALSGTAVLINEFGEVGLDHHLIERIDETWFCCDQGVSAAPSAANWRWPCATCIPGGNVGSCRRSGDWSSRAPGWPIRSRSSQPSRLIRFCAITSVREQLSQQSTR